MPVVILCLGRDYGNVVGGEGCDYRNDVSMNAEKLDILEHPLDGSGENQLNLYKCFPDKLMYYLQTRETNLSEGRNR